MNRAELFFGAIRLPLDFLAIVLAGATAYFLRVSTFVQELRPAAFVVDLPWVEFMQLTSIVALIIVIIFAIQGMYAMQVTRRLRDEATGIFGGITLGIMIVIVIIFLRAELFQSRFILLAAYLLAILYVSVGRYIVRQLQRILLQRGLGIHRVVLAGNGRYGTMLHGLFRSRPELGYRVVGTLPLVRWDMLENVYQAHGIDEVIQTDPSLPEEDNMLLLDFCEHYKIDYKYIPNLFESHAAHVHFRQIGPVPIMELRRTPLEGWGRIAKRIMDIAGASLGLLLLSPFLAIVALLIMLDSRGSVLYTQMRIGRNMRPFPIHKFRSMFAEYCVGKEYGGTRAEKLEAELRQRSNERKGPLFKMRRDPRITRIGRFIRKWRVDELPQLLNVLRGDMSLLGPRPHLPKEVAKYDAYQRKLFTIKPGMSGMAQVSGNAGLSFDEEAKLDVFYIENWSLWLDAVLLFKTCKILFRDPNAV